VTSAAKIPIAEQISAVANSAMVARATGEYSGDKAVIGRADQLDAAVRTLRWVRDNAEQLRRAVSQQETHAERRRFRDMPLAQQAALRCGDPTFQKFMRVGGSDEAARAVRAACKVESRAELDKVPEAGAVWRRLNDEFEVWLRGIGDGDASTAPVEGTGKTV
jgi:hypothetical protein